jgi:hypothetical protein
MVFRAPARDGTVEAPATNPPLSRPGPACSATGASITAGVEQQGAAAGELSRQAEGLRAEVGRFLAGVRAA